MTNNEMPKVGDIYVQKCTKNFEVPYLWQFNKSIEVGSEKIILYYFTNYNNSDGGKFFIVPHSELEESLEKYTQQVKEEKEEKLTRSNCGKVCEYPINFCSNEYCSLKCASNGSGYELRSPSENGGEEGGKGYSCSHKVLENHGKYPPENDDYISYEEQMKKMKQEFEEAPDGFHGIRNGFLIRKDDFNDYVDASVNQALAEEEKPKSIWKDVSELPKNKSCLFVRRKDGNIVPSNYDDHALLHFSGNCKEDIESWSYLTDFINHVDSLEQRIRKLEGK